MRLVTKAEYDKASATQQGYVAYMQGDLPGSELKGLTNPYTPQTKLSDEWNHGQALGVQVAQDSEDQRD